MLTRPIGFLHCYVSQQIIVLTQRHKVQVCENENKGHNNSRTERKDFNLRFYWRTHYIMRLCRASFQSHNTKLIFGKEVFTFPNIRGIRNPQCALPLNCRILVFSVAVSPVFVNFIVPWKQREKSISLAQHFVRWKCHALELSCSFSHVVLPEKILTVIPSNWRLYISCINVSVMSTRSQVKFWRPSSLLRYGIELFKARAILHTASYVRGA